MNRQQAAILAGGFLAALLALLPAGNAFPAEPAAGDTLITFTPAATRDGGGDGRGLFGEGPALPSFTPRPTDDTRRIAALAANDAGPDSLREIDELVAQALEADNSWDYLTGAGEALFAAGHYREALAFFSRAGDFYGQAYQADPVRHSSLQSLRLRLLACCARLLSATGREDYLELLAEVFQETRRYAVSHGRSLPAAAMLAAVQLNTARENWGEALSACRELESQLPAGTPDWFACRLDQARAGRRLGDRQNWEQAFTALVTAWCFRQVPAETSDRLAGEFAALGEAVDDRRRQAACADLAAKVRAGEQSPLAQPPAERAGGFRQAGNALTVRLQLDGNGVVRADAHGRIINDPAGAGRRELVEAVNFVAGLLPAVLLRVDADRMVPFGQVHAVLDAGQRVHLPEIQLAMPQALYRWEVYRDGAGGEREPESGIRAPERFGLRLMSEESALAGNAAVLRLEADGAIRAGGEGRLLTLDELTGWLEGELAGPGPAARPLALVISPETKYHRVQTTLARLLRARVATIRLALDE